jgi:hypothetical protein
MRLDPAVEIILLVKAAFGRLDQDRQGKVNGIKLGMDQYIKLKNSNHIEVQEVLRACQRRLSSSHVPGSGPCGDRSIRRGVYLLWVTSFNFRRRSRIQ